MILCCIHINTNTIMHLQHFHQHNSITHSLTHSLITLLTCMAACSTMLCLRSPIEKVACALISMLMSPGMGRWDKNITYKIEDYWYASEVW